MLVVGIGSLVHRVSRYRRNGAALRRMYCGDLDFVGAHLTQHCLLAAVGLSAERCAFEHLAQIVGLIGGKAVMDRRCREDAAVTAASADNDLRASL